jgi:hypothetical protein
MDKEAMRAKFRLLGPLGKGHNIVVYIRESASKIAQFVKLAGRLVPMDNRMRWNSWYEMLDVLLLLRPHIEAYCQAHEEELEDNILSFKEWGRLRMIRDFLYLFTRAILFTKGDSTSINHMLFIMDILIKYI